MGCVGSPGTVWLTARCVWGGADLLQTRALLFNRECLMAQNGRCRTQGGSLEGDALIPCQQCTFFPGWECRR